MGKVSAHGFVSYAADGSPTYLPLKSVFANIYIVDVSARVVLKQRYINDRSNKECASAQYIFPVPANGAVCAFKMQSADGRIVKGIVKERSKAEKEYEFAIAQNQFAGLLYEATPDIFVISIGAIPRGQDVEVTIMYVVPLSDGDLPGYDSVEFILPTYVATRYGPPPSSLPSLFSLSSITHTTLDIVAEIQMPSAITSVTSSSHAIKVYTSNGNGDDTKSPIHTSRVTLDPAGPPPRLNRDFVLSIQAVQLGEPRCVAEILEHNCISNTPNISKTKKEKETSVALSLTFVPRFRMQALPAQEYIFLIDRSGSMAGHRIQHAKDALVLFLKSLPSQGTLFNIFSFGSGSSSLWNSSRGYAATDINIALDHVNAMDANMGGTEIESGVRNVLSSRNTSVPTSIFLLTDGEVHSLDSLLALISFTVSKSLASPTSLTSSAAHLRFFTLGVGDAASTALCEGVARVGNGRCLMATNTGDIAQKCARLLEASKVPSMGDVRDVRVDWGYPPGSGAVSASAASSSPSHGVTIQQAPSRIPDLHPSNRFTVSAIITIPHTHSKAAVAVPKTVALRGTLPDGTCIALPDVKVCQTLDQQGRDGRFVGERLPPLIHTLAAHRIIQELEDGNRVSLSVDSRADGGRDKERERDARDAIVHLSERYQLASKFASFIAVEGDGDWDEDRGDANTGDDKEDDDADIGKGSGQGQGKNKNKNNPAPATTTARDNANHANADDDDDDDNFYYDDEDEERARRNKLNTATSNAGPVGDAHGLSAGGHSVWPGVEPLAPGASRTAPAKASNPNPQPSNFNSNSNTNTIALPRSTGASTSGGWPGVDPRPQPRGTSTSGNFKTTNLNPPSTGGLWPGVEPVASPAHATSGQSSINTAAALPRQRGASTSGRWGTTTTSSKSGMPTQASQRSQIRAPSSLPPLLATGATTSKLGNASANASGSIQLSPSHFVNAFKPPGPASSPLRAPHRTTTPIAVQRSASTRSDRGVYFLETVVNTDSVEGRSSTPLIVRNQIMPGSYLVDDALPSSTKPRACSTATHTGQVENSSDLVCLSPKMPDCHAPSPGLRRSKTEVSPYPRRERPHSILYELETAACSPSLPELHSSTAVLGTLEEDEDEDEEPENASPPVFTVTASSKTGLYKAQRKPTAIAPAPWTTGAPIIAAARLQSFDGSFELDDELYALIGRKVSLQRLKTAIPVRLKAQQDADKIWGTVLAAAYLKKALPDDKEVWIGLWNKAAEYVEMKLGAGVSFATLVDEASKLL
ncbi:hypothetical protein CVT25_001154 [Psilocybe cyanescens]|uniref:VIT domain-containing protein n=1 Tax=Psilocybe cyanescens TaxID=93625 RepID=A0A409XEJ1_PSICY|nr:hypothetical protein CVT25_001154 [Psilocybe cyanescens]